MDAATTQPALDALHDRIVVVGAGPAGLAAALALAARGIASTLVGPAAAGSDTRTTALLGASIPALERMGVWAEARANAAPLRVMTIVDATQRLIRARPLAFDACEIGLDAFGWNIANLDLVAALEAAAARAPLVRRIVVKAAEVTAAGSAVRFRLEDGAMLSCALAIAADGRESPTRAAAGIAVSRWDYPQTAITLNLTHTRPHRDTSTEFHTETGAFTLVPLRGLRSSLVWMVGADQAEALLALDDPALALEIERKCQSMLGAMTVAGPRSSWPMAGLSPKTLAARRVALVGETAHVFPPVGAQGFNLTLRDIEALADAVTGADDPGAPEVLDRYARSHRADVFMRTGVIDMLNRSMLTGFLPVQAARSLGLEALARVGPLRRLVMRRGLAPGSQARA